MANKKDKAIAEIIHWYDKIGVAVIKLAGVLKMGDKIVVRRHDHEFKDTILSMQVDHEDVSKGKKGDEVAIKLSEATKEGALIYKDEE
jgi:translation initiation factor IF-2